MDTIIQKIQEKVRSLSPAEGGRKTGIPFITAWRFTSKNMQMPNTNHPYLYIVLDGMLRLYTPSGMMDYMAGQYSLSKIDTPLSGTVLTFSQQQDFLALSVEFTTNDVITAVLDLDNDLTEKIMNQTMEEKTMSVADSAVIHSVYRLLTAMTQTVGSEFLRNNIMQEVIYYLLCGSCGQQFLQSIINIGQADKIYEANS